MTERAVRVALFVMAVAGCDGSASHATEGGSSGNGGEGSAPVPEDALRAVDIAADNMTACAVDAQGAAWCWGLAPWRSSSEMGATARRVEGSSDLEKVTVGYDFGCGITTLQELWCWTDQENFPVQRTAADGTAALQVPLAEVRAVAAGTDHVCAVDAEGRIWCWGRNLDGQIAGDTFGTGAPYALEQPSEVASVNAGYSKTCAVTGAGAVWCWGLVIDLVDLPQGSESRTWEPLQVTFVSDVVEISSSYDGACALHADATVSCWGEIVPDGVDSTAPLRWYRVPELEDVVQVSAGPGHACALRSDGTAWCWGRNNYGQLGDGTETDSDRPVQVTGFTDVAKIIAGGSVTLLIDGDGVVWGWGSILSPVIRNEGGFGAKLPIVIADD